MRLDKRSSELFEALMERPGVNSKELEKEYQVTRRQLGYSFGKINDWLRSMNLPEIERTRQGYFIVDSTLHAKMGNEPEIKSQYSDILTEYQRIYIIILMLLGSEEELSLNHFTIELAVSKNTVLNDMKRVKEVASGYELTIRYSRINGYVVEGEEFQVRKFLLHAVEKIMELPYGKTRVKQALEMDEVELLTLQSRIEKVENKLNLKFTDEKILIMPYTFLLVLRRIRREEVIKTFPIQYGDLSGTMEYQATEEVLFDIEDIPEQERLFITLHLLTTNLYQAQMLTEETIPYLKQELDEMLRLFETNACVFLQDRNRLLDKLLLHVTPAYYRIKYQLTDVEEGQSLVSQEYKELHHLVKQSTAPLANLIGNEIPESEVAYLTMLIGGWLRKQGESIEEKVKAIVVCPKGVSVSRLMLTELRYLFKEFVFLDSLSLREFQHYKLEYDIVFSPVFLETDKKLFLASSFLGESEKKRLRRQVMMELNGFAPTDVNLEELLTVIKRHATIRNEQQLSKELKQHIYPMETDEQGQEHEQKSANLDDFITLERITLRKSVHSWEEAIRTSAIPLVENNDVLPGYVEAVIDHCKTDPYIVIGNHIAIPHAAPEDGVNRTGMSLLRLEEGVCFTNQYLIQLVVVIAAVDKEQHLNALLQLLKLAQSDQGREALLQAKSSQGIYDVIKEYSEE